MHDFSSVESLIRITSGTFRLGLPQVGMSIRMAHGALKEFDHIMYSIYGLTVIFWLYGMHYKVCTYICEYVRVLKPGSAKTAKLFYLKNFPMYVRYLIAWQSSCITCRNAFSSVCSQPQV